MGNANIYEPSWIQPGHSAGQQPDATFVTYSGFKSELPADNEVKTVPSPAPHSFVSPDPSTHYAQSVSNGSTVTPTHVNGSLHVSPQSTGNGGSPELQSGEGGMAPIYELQ